MSKSTSQGSSGLMAFCGACGRQFVKTREWQVFCSMKCRRDSWKADKLNARRIIQLEARLDRIEKQIGLGGER